jgi:PucR family transcriptional regulator, purine catabolism regulatory protein
MVLIVPASGLETLYQRLDRFARQDNPPARLAISEPVSWIMLAPTTLRQARFAAGLQRAGVLPGAVVRCDRLDDIGVFGLLYHLWGNPAVDVFCHDVLGELEAYDERRGTGLIETLEVYLSSGGSVSEAARQLNVHRNTLAYRIGRIGELSGRDLARPEDRLLLRVALLCRHLLPNA